MHRHPRRDLSPETIVERIGLGIDQSSLDVPEAVIPPIATTIDIAAVDVLPRGWLA
jgi:hypothetical protein